METALIRAISAIHRSDSLDSFESAFLGHVSAAIEAEAFGLYLLSPRLQTLKKFVGTGAPTRFLEEYESYRALDPIYDFVVRERVVADGVNLLGTRDWRFHPLHAWLRNWGWQHSLQGPLVIGGEVAGTVNFARGTARGAFTARSRRLAHVICEEVSAALERLLQRHETAAQLNLLTSCFESAPMPLAISNCRGEVRILNRRARAGATSVPGLLQPTDPLRRVAQVVAELATSSKDTLALRTDECGTFVSVRLLDCDDLYLSAWDLPGGGPSQSAG